MSQPDVRPYRSDRLIAGARLALLSFSLAAVSLDPRQPLGAILGSGRMAYALLGLYGLYAAIRCVVAWNARFPPLYPLLILVVDVAALAVLIFATGAPSPLAPLFA